MAQSNKFIKKIIIFIEVFFIIVLMEVSINLIYNTKIFDIEIGYMNPFILRLILLILYGLLLCFRKNFFGLNIFFLLQIIISPMLFWFHLDFFNILFCFILPVIGIIFVNKIKYEILLTTQNSKIIPNSTNNFKNIYLDLTGWLMLIWLIFHIILFVTTKDKSMICLIFTPPSWMISCLIFFLYFPVAFLRIRKLKSKDKRLFILNIILFFLIIILFGICTFFKI